VGKAGRGGGGAAGPSITPRGTPTATLLVPVIVVNVLVTGGRRPVARAQEAEAGRVRWL
jgi:hypothetical protein